MSERTAAEWWAEWWAEHLPAVAHHEAGHAVAAVLRGREIVSVWVSPDHPTHLGNVRSVGAPWDAGFTAFAGPWAESRYLVETGHEDALADVWDTFQLLWDASGPGDADFLAVEQDLETRWRAIEAVAATAPPGAPPLPSHRGALWSSLWEVWDAELAGAWAAVQAVASRLAEGHGVTHADVVAALGE